MRIYDNNVELHCAVHPRNIFRKRRIRKRHGVDTYADITVAQDTYSSVHRERLYDDIVVRHECFVTPRITRTCTQRESHEFVEQRELNNDLMNLGVALGVALMRSTGIEIRRNPEGMDNKIVRNSLTTDARNSYASYARARYYAHLR